MVDTQDLKSCDHNGCAGSSPAPGTENRARVRVSASELELELSFFFPRSRSHFHTLFCYEPFNEFFGWTENSGNIGTRSGVIYSFADLNFKIKATPPVNHE